MSKKKVTQIYGTMYTVFRSHCLPRLWDEDFRDEDHLRHEMQEAAMRGLTGWNFPNHADNVQLIVNYAVAAWQVITLSKQS